MNRNHQVFTIDVEHEKTVFTPEPGTGEMRNTGTKVTVVDSVTVIAPTIEYARQWVWERFHPCAIRREVAVKVDGCVELHTW